jgi:M6 family metalloprotease-like protein
MKQPRRIVHSLACTVAALSLLTVLQAHEPLTPEEIAALKQGGTYEERTARIGWLRPEKVSKGVAEDARSRLQEEAMRAAGKSEAQIAEAVLGPQFAFPYKASPELPSTGSVKTLTILVDFADMRADDVLPGLTKESIEANIYGNGTAGAQDHIPYESVRAYYKRASQGKVDVGGTVLGWYHFPKKRAEYQPKYSPGMTDQQKMTADNRALFAMLKEALASFDSGHDFKQFDNDNDGDIDLVTMLYAGPRTGWGSFWWAYRWEFFVPEAASQRFDTKRAKQFVFQFTETRGQTDYNPVTLLHEMGHAFGLADYYDYKPGVGPEGGLGGLDMMDANMGNQNAFSRWLLDWIKPEVVGNGSATKRTLVASGSTRQDQKAIAIFPQLADGDAPTQEMFIVENRWHIGNDGGVANLPNSGLLIWHVVARPNVADSNFAFDNSATPVKLIRLLRPGKMIDFNAGERADASCFFNPPALFGPDSVPPSLAYDGTATRVIVSDISAPGEVMTAVIGIVDAPSAPLNNPAALAGAVPTPASAPAGDAIDLAALRRQRSEMQKSTPEELRTLWEKEVARPSKTGRSAQAFRTLVLTSWAQKDGRAAIAAALGAGEGAVATNAIPSIIEAWANNAPAEATDWLFTQRKLQTLKLTGGSKQFLAPVFEWLARNNVDTAISSLHDLSIPETDIALAAIKSAVGPGLKEADLNAKLQTLGDAQEAVAAVHKFQNAAETLQNQTTNSEMKFHLESLTKEKMRSIGK